MEQEIFAEQNIPKAYIKLSLPLVFSMVVGLIYNLADTFFVAQTGNTDLIAGVSLGVPVFTFLMAIGNIFGLGGSSLISRLLGQQDADGSKRVSAFAFYGSLLTGVVLGALMILFRTPLVYLIGADADTFRHLSDYYLFLSIGAPFVIESFVHSNLLRAEGMSKESMIGTVGGAVVNIILDPLLISGLHWGAAGAAIASVLGYVFSDTYFAIVVYRKSRSLSIDPRKMGIPFDFLRQIFGIGIPAAIVNIMQSVSIIVINQFLLPYGNDKIAAMGIAMKASMIALLVLTGLSFGGQPLYGYYYGAKDRKRLWELLCFCLKFLSGAAIVLSGAVFLTAPWLMRAFVSDAQIIADGTLMLRLQVVTMIFVAIVLLMTIIFQAAGKIVGSFLLSISRQGVVFLVVLFVAVSLFGYMGILAAQAVADVLTACFALLLFYKELYPEFRPQT